MAKRAPFMLNLLVMPMFTYSLYLSLHSNIQIMEWEIMSLVNPIYFSVISDWSGCLYSACVLLISANVLLFSKKYMKEDVNINRFTYIVLLFILSMNMLIFIPNLITLLLGWDGLGITSFILVIYYNNARSLGAGLITMLTNRLGDVFLLMAIAASLDMAHWMPMIYSSDKMFLLQWLGIMVAAMTKSAQMPFSSWLPAAMAAPTPVSALVHSSTLVTAGVFLLYRFSSLLQQSSLMLFILTLTGIMTTIMAGIAGMYENDMKKIIALSTLSQLGLMFTALGMSMPKLAFFHMCTHAMFKSLLFITAGCLIASSSHNQDLRLFGSHLPMSPINASSFLISSSALMGLPFMSGYYSKHLIMEWSFMSINMMLFITLMVAIFLTSAYSSRLITSMSLKPMSNNYWQESTSPNEYSTPMITMSVMSIISGSMIQWMMPTIPKMSNPVTSELSSSILSITLLTVLIFTILYYKSMTKYLLWNTSMNYLVPTSAQGIIGPSMKVSLLLSKFLDQTWTEMMTSYGPSTQIKTMSTKMDKTVSMQTQKSLMSSAITCFATILVVTLIFS